MFQVSCHIRGNRPTLRSFVVPAIACLLNGTIMLLAADEPQAPHVEIAPDAAVQAALMEAFNSKDRAEFDLAAGQVIALRKSDDSQIVPQLLWFAAMRMRDDDRTADLNVNRDPNQAARTKAFVGQVLARLTASKTAIVVVLAPHLDNRIDAIRSMVREVLSGYEDGSPTRPPDFSPYRAAIEADVRAGREPQTSLVRMMFESDPGIALQTMVLACQLRDPDEIKWILWSEHVVAELFWKRRYGFVARDAVDAASRAELDKLSRHPRWWVRLYAAEIGLKHAELAVPAMVDRLRSDADARVRETFRQANAVEAETASDGS